CHGAVTSLDGVCPGLLDRLGVLAVESLQQPGASAIPQIAHDLLHRRSRPSRADNGLLRCTGSVILLISRAISAADLKCRNHQRLRGLADAPEQRQMRLRNAADVFAPGVMSEKHASWRIHRVFERNLVRATGRCWIG